MNSKNVTKPNKTVVGFWALVGLGLLFVLIVSAGLSFYFEREARPGEAVVTDLRISKSTGRRSRTAYHVTYDFVFPTPVNGQTSVTKDEQVVKAIYDKLKIGQKVAVRYLPQDPTWVALRDTGLEWYMGLVWLVGLGFSVMTFAVAWSAFGAEETARANPWAT